MAELAARRSDRAAEAASDPARRMVRRAAQRSWKASSPTRSRGGARGRALRHARQRPDLSATTMFEDVFKEMPGTCAAAPGIRGLGCRDSSASAVPAKAGTHFQPLVRSPSWLPAFSGTCGERRLGRAGHAVDDDGPGAELGDGRDAGARSRRRDLRRGCRLFRRRVPRHRRAAAASTASSACSTRRSPRAACWRRRSAWAPMACGRSSRSSSPTTSIRRPTSSSRRRRGCAIARAASSGRR